MAKIGVQLRYAQWPDLGPVGRSGRGPALGARLLFSAPLLNYMGRVKRRPSRKEARTYAMLPIQPNVWPGYRFWVR
jgi:hypothetical protein